MNLRFFLPLFSCFIFLFPARYGTAETERDIVPIDESLELGDPQLDVLWIDEQNGNFLPVDSVWQDEEGNTTTFGDIIDRPTLILPIYFYCPSSCSLNLVNLATAVKRTRLDSSKDFKVIAFSFNEEENSDNSRVAKRNYLRLLPDDFPPENWKFLTGSKESIDKAVASIGYTFKPQGDGTFIHPSALVVAAEDGKIIKYVYGKFVSGDVDMAIAEAQKGTPAMSVKRFLNYCFNYDTNKSTNFFQNLKLAVLAGFAVMGILFFIYLRKTNGKKGSQRDKRI